MGDALEGVGVVDGGDDLESAPAVGALQGVEPPGPGEKRGPCRGALLAARTARWWLSLAVRDVAGFSLPTPSRTHDRGVGAVLPPGRGGHPLETERGDVLDQPGQELERLEGDRARPVRQ